MAQKIQPIMVSTYEGWLRSLDSGWDAIYIERCLMKAEMYQKMNALGYCVSDWLCRRGVLFTKPHISEIYDPMGIL